MGDGSPFGKRRALTVALPLAVVAGLVWYVNRTPEPAPAPESAPPPAGQGAAGGDGPATSVARTEPVPDAEPEETAAAAGPAEPAAAEPDQAPGEDAEAEVPAFDLVRVEPDGSAAVVGTAAPGSTVTIYADEAPLAETQADAQGNFVAMFDVEPSTAPRALTLDAAPAGGGPATGSPEVVMLLPRAPAAPADASGDASATGPEAAPPAAADGEAEPSAPGPGPEVAAGTPAAEPAAAPAEVAATAILREDAVEVLPPPGDPGAARDLTLASISYSKAGQVTLAGVGTAGSVLRAYVDEEFAQEARVAADGRWNMDLGGVAEGLYRLRIDQIAGDGRVASRVETPFQRDYPDAPRRRPGRPGVPGVPSVTVQPGHNLWTLARERYGSGTMYTQIFTANREQIRDPDLIYPGQIFAMPEPDAAE